LWFCACTVIIADSAGGCKKNTNLGQENLLNKELPYCTISLVRALSLTHLEVQRPYRNGWSLTASWYNSVMIREKKLKYFGEELEDYRRQYYSNLGESWGELSYMDRTLRADAI
jgi:hypothetical protein